MLIEDGPGCNEVPLASAEAIALEMVYGSLLASTDFLEVEEFNISIGNLTPRH